jgi:hypothetical protein
MFSLAAYSLIYGNRDSNFYIAVNHAMQSFVATALICSGLLFFPKIYYYLSWRRGFLNVLSELEVMTEVLSRGENLTIKVISGTLVMDRFAKMLPRKMAYYSVLKINLICLDLVMSISYLSTFQKQIRLPYIALLHRYILLLKESCKKRIPVIIPANDHHLFDETYELHLIYQLMKSWNNLCLNN